MDYVGLVVVDDVRAGGREGRPGVTFAMERVANRPIAHHVLDTLEAAGVEDVLVASSAEQAELVRDGLDTRARSDCLRLEFIQTPGALDLAAALTLAAPIVGDTPCIAHLANGLLGQPLGPLLDCVARDRPDVALFMHQRPAPDCRLSAATRQMLCIAELHPTVASFGIAGLWLFGRDALRTVAATGWTVGEEVDLTKLAGPIATAEGGFHVGLVDTWCRYAGDPGDLLELNTMTLDALPANGHPPGSYGNRIEGRVLIDRTACVRESIILGPAVIGPHARISDAYIGPYTSIGADVKIMSAEIERSIVCAGASITHIGGRLVASVIGPGARVFKDFSLPRAVRLRVGEGNEVALC